MAKAKGETPERAVEAAREQVAQLEARARTQPDVERELGQARDHVREVERVAAEAELAPRIEALNAADLADAQELERLARLMAPAVERFRARSAREGRAVRQALTDHGRRYGSAPPPPRLPGPGWPSLFGWSAGVSGALAVLDRARERAANPPPPPEAVPRARLLGGDSPAAERQREALVMRKDGAPVAEPVGPGGRRPRVVREAP